MPILVTEQYPNGLGHTVPELIQGYETALPVFAKTQFSMLIPEVKKFLHESHGSGPIEHVLLCGIEAHVCILNTALSLVEEGFKVHVVVDACASRNQVDRLYAFERMKQSGIYLTTTESALLALVCGSDHPKFRSIQKLIMQKSPNSGLPGSEPEGSA